MIALDETSVVWAIGSAMTVVAYLTLTAAVGDVAARMREAHPPGDRSASP